MLNEFIKIYYILMILIWGNSVKCKLVYSDKANLQMPEDCGQVGVRRKKNVLQKDTWKFQDVMNTLLVLMVLQIYGYMKLYQTISFK